jgi:oligosaccharyltransferase complex subunit beta
MNIRVAYAQDITPQSLVALLSRNTNVLIAFSQKQTPITSLASEFSLILPPPGTPLISHFPERKEPPTVIPITPPTSHPMLSPNLSPIWFSGIPHAFGTNPYIFPVLNAPSESFAADSNDDSGANVVVDASEKGGEGLWAGHHLGVVSGFQTKYSTRVAWVGGVDMFTDKFFKKEISKLRRHFIHENNTELTTVEA